MSKQKSTSCVSTTTTGSASTKTTQNTLTIALVFSRAITIVVVQPLSSALSGYNNFLFHSANISVSYVAKKSVETQFRDPHLGNTLCDLICTMGYRCI